jgi:hypothetical protein
MTRTRIKAPFKSMWTITLANLGRELGKLGAKKIEIALELKDPIRDLRRDGKLSASARPGAPVVLSFLDVTGTRHAYPCDRFTWWQDNLHAIAVVLEDLRRAERYGVQSSLIRAGFKSLPATTSKPIDATSAAIIIADLIGSAEGASIILSSADAARTAARTAAHRWHPDKHEGKRDEWDRLEAARSVLASHHGVSV